MLNYVEAAFFQSPIDYFPKSGTFGQISAKWELFSNEKDSAILFPIFTHLHAKLGTNPWSGFQDDFVTHEADNGNILPHA